jgi:UDP-2,3-diacylglucosamine hydrolase
VRPVLFVSDLHLSPERPAIVERFFRFLREEARAAAALYILGDLLEHWLGDDDADEAFNRELLERLAALAGSGVELSLMHGNRDFLFGAAAAARAALKLIPDPSERELFGVPTLLMHGDTLCTDDVRYQRYRAWVRRRGVARAFVALPRGLRRAIGGGLKRVSAGEKRIKARSIMDVNPGAVEAVLREHRYPRLIHGHTHRPGRHVHVVDGHPCERWVLADWYERGSYLRCDASGCTSMALQ